MPSRKKFKTYVLKLNFSVFLAVKIMPVVYTYLCRLPLCSIQITLLNTKINLEALISIVAEELGLQVDSLITTLWIADWLEKWLYSNLNCWS